MPICDQVCDRIRDLANGKRGEARGRFANRLAPIRAIRRPAMVRIALSGKMRPKFFFRGESGVPETLFARRARVRHAVKQQRRRPHIEMTHHRNAHLTVVFCNLRIILVARCAVREFSRHVPARQRMRRLEAVREDVTSTSPRCERFFFLSACSNRDAVPAIRAGA